jgi:hypothetical protein
MISVIKASLVSCKIDMHVIKKTAREYNLQEPKGNK